MGLQYRRAARIQLRALHMLPAIQFNNQPRLDTREIGNIPANRNLSPKLVALQLLLTQQSPKPPFGFGGLVTKLLSDL